MSTRSMENIISALVRIEEVYGLQRSTVNWMREGDRNSKFFHRVANGRRKRNMILSIIDEVIVEHKEEEDIQRVFVGHFSKIFKTKGNLEMEEVLGIVSNELPIDMMNKLAQPFTEEEVTKALFQMHHCKAPDPMICPLSFFFKF